MIDRRKVLWLGGPPGPADHYEHEQRGLLASAVCADSLSHEAMDLIQARGLVLNAVPPHVPTVGKALGYIATAVNHGLEVLVLLADSVTHAWVQEKLEHVVPAGPARDRIRYRIAAKSPEIAESFARYNAGPAVNQALNIVLPDGLELPDQQIFLLQRAFSDCSSISVAPLPGGRSATTLLVHATLANSLAGPHPLPFFAKIDRSVQILTERDCYERYAQTHIAWYLRPDLQASRCLIGTQLGILVGSFVTKSDSLWSLIQQGRADEAIQSLFGETLASWREPKSVMNHDAASIAPALAKVFAHQSVRRRYVEAAANLGYTYDPASIWEGFLNLPTRDWPRAPIHGDLHAENVRVRGQDVIIIDLARVTMGPPTADPACMEVWIAFQVSAATVSVDEDAWLLTVRELFLATNVFTPPDDPSMTAPFLWLRRGVLQTRRAGLVNSTPVEYAITLALYLLRRAMFEPDSWAPDVDARRRTWAWILGCRLFETVQQFELIYQEAA